MMSEEFLFNVDEGGEGAGVEEVVEKMGCGVEVVGDDKVGVNETGGDSGCERAGGVGGAGVVVDGVSSSAVVGESGAAADVKMVIVEADDIGVDGNRVSVEGDGTDDDWFSSVLSACGLSESEGGSTGCDSKTSKKKKKKTKKRKQEGESGVVEKKLVSPAMVVGGRRCQPGTPVRRTGVWTDRRREEVKAKWKDVMGVRVSKGDSPDYSKREKMVLVKVRKFNEEERDKYLKRAKGDNYVRDAVQEVLNVPFEKVVKRTAQMTGCSEGSVKRFTSQLNKLELTPKRRPGKRSFTCPDWILTDIRLIITAMYGYRGGKKEGRKYPTVANVREEFYNIHEGVPDADPTLGEIPLVSQSTFKKWMKKAGYSFGKLTGRSVAIARKEAAEDLAIFLREIRKFRSAGYKIYYMDETWCNKNHAKSTMWRRATSAMGPAHFLYEGGMELPSGEGQRLIICHVMSEDGLLEGAADIFIGQKKAEDYHSEMNGVHFEKYIEKHILENIWER